MTTDRDILTEIARRLRLAEQEAGKAASHLRAIEAARPASADARWIETMAGMRSMSEEIVMMQRIFNVSWLRSVRRSQTDR